MSKIINLTVLQDNKYSLPVPATQPVPVNIFASPVNVLVNGVQANALVEVPATGLNQIAQSLLVEETVSEIVALANAGGTTTTTTTTLQPSYGYNVTAAYSAPEACNSGTPMTVYSGSPIGLGVQIFLDSNLTVPYDANAYGGYISYSSNKYSVSGNVIQDNGIPCSTNQENAYPSNDPGVACAQTGTLLTVYYSGTLGDGTMLYTDPALTVPYSTGTYGGYVGIYFEAAPQLCTMFGNTIMNHTAC